VEQGKLEAFKSWLQQSLTAVRNELGMETAIASFIENENYTIVAVDSVMEGVFEAGQVFPLQDTYCRAVYESKRPVSYYHVATVESMLQHPVYQAVKLESYIAAPILNDDGEVMGTINFTSLEPHKPHFTKEEQTLVETLAEQVSKQFASYKAALEH